MSAQPARAVNVTQYHNDSSRSGLYIEPAFTKSAAAGLHRDLLFNGTISGNVYAQPLYIEGGPGGVAMIIAVTESNNVYALDAATGGVLWQRNFGLPVPTSQQPCGNINPLGITGTPVVDLPSRMLLFNAVTNFGTTAHHLVYALNVDTGIPLSGWPVDVGATAISGTNTFLASYENQRGALLILNGTVYIPYGGHSGDCGNYRAWVVGIPLTNPGAVTAWATTAVKGGAWAVGGLASDGTNVFVATGNTSGTTTWGGGEAIIRLQPGPVFTGASPDYWAPTNWHSLDNADLDIGGTGPLLVDVPGATPSQLIVALGKDGNGYLLDRNNLGGIHVPLAQANSIAAGSIIQAAATYHTSQGTYFAFYQGTHVNALRIPATSPPTIGSGWSGNQNGGGSPFVTSTDGTNNVIVWGLGAEGDQRLHGFDADTGAVVFGGGGANELMSGTRHLQTAIAARGRIYVATDNKVYAFTVPVAPIQLAPSLSTDNTFQISFTNAPGLSFSILSTADLGQPFAQWTLLGRAEETASGIYQFTNPVPNGNPQRFYRVRSP
jgi:hypothetical protein